MAPDTTRAIVGWRVWKVKYHGGMYREGDAWRKDISRAGLRLFAWTRETPWPAGHEFDSIADSRRCIDSDHPRLNCGCKCGLHAFKTKEHLIESLDMEHRGPLHEGPFAYGRVSLWGRYVEAERGWRARYGYPYDVRIVGTDDPAVARDLADAYAIDVTYTPTWDAVIEVEGVERDCDTDGHVWSVSTNGDRRCTFCHASFMDTEWQRITGLSGIEFPKFGSRQHALAWFTRVAAQIMDAGRAGGMEEMARRQVTMIRDLLRPLLDYEFGQPDLRVPWTNPRHGVFTPPPVTWTGTTFIAAPAWFPYTGNNT